VSYRSLTIAALVAAAALGGCDSFYRAIGTEKVVPDEFAVVSRAPLAVPPDFSLRPPRLGAQRPQEQAPVDQARQTVFRAGDQDKGNLPPAAATRSDGEGALLREAGAADAPKDIRQLVETDATTSNDMSDRFVDTLAFWRKDQKLGPTDDVINPVAESERLKDARDKDEGADDATKALDTPAGSAGAPAALASAPRIERTGGSGSSSSSSSWFGWIGNIF
jgi:hypothetical protein